MKVSRDRLWLWVLGGLAAALMLLGLGSYSVVNGDEAIYQSIARTMVETGDFGRLDFEGEARPYDTFMNAPLQYWMRAGLIVLFGDNLWTMRILAALFGVATVLITVRLGWALEERRGALLAGGILLSTYQFVYLHSARTGELETMVTFVYVGVALLFLRAVERGGGFVAHHLCLVALLNLKLPIVFVPLVAELACFTLVPSTRPIFRRFVLSGAAIVPFGLAWHVWQAIHSPDYFTLATDVMAAQFTGTLEWGATLPFGEKLTFYAAALAFGSFPYAVAYPFALVGVLRNGRSDANADRWRMLALFGAAVFVFYAAVGKHNAWYVIPAYPFLSLFLGAWLIRVPVQSRHTLAKLATAAVITLLVCARVDLGTLNPFATRAAIFPMEVEWRQFIGVPTIVGATLLASVVTLALTRGRASGRLLFAVLVVALLGTATIRVVRPLAHLGYQSKLSRIHEALESARRVERPVDFPVRLPDPSLWIARFYFAEHYEIVPVRDNRGLALLLYPMGDPRAIGASIRKGLIRSGRSATGKIEP